MPVSSKKMSVSRLKTIYKRQAAPRWDPTYQPGILATPQEAPSRSRAFILTPGKFGGREVHLLSRPELHAVLLGLYNPRCIGLQEQRMLSPEPTEHPLWTMEGLDRTNLPFLKGIIDVADRLGHLDILPRIKIPKAGSPGVFFPTVFPWFGDLLWAFQDKNGATRCVNWTVKDSYEDFKRLMPKWGGKIGENSISNKALVRHEIEQIYYEDANIPTVMVADEKIDSHVSGNLRQLFLHHRRDLDLLDEQRWEIQHKFQLALERGIPPTDVIIPLVERGRYSVDQCRSVLYQAIWNRAIRVDLFQPVLINRPLHPEIQDVLDAYAKWFGGQ